MQETNASSDDGIFCICKVCIFSKLLIIEFNELNQVCSPVRFECPIDFRVSEAELEVNTNNIILNNHQN